MKKKIRIIENGPYEASGFIPLSQARSLPDPEDKGASLKWEKGKTYPKEQNCYLCRCGHSEHKPYCDGTHNHIGFEGSETAKHGKDDSGTVQYSGKNAILHDEEKLCATGRFCDRGINAWNAAEQSADEECLNLAITEVANCPSGRLTLENPHDHTFYEPDLEQEIHPIQDLGEECRGPLWVKGGIQVEGADGKTYRIRNRMTLCRCGESKNKPFCDSSHLNCPHMKGFDNY
ncbi:MAG: CDGSH iron-sulfur domain-containing protein [Christensenellaceae bacterium]